MYHIENKVIIAVAANLGISPGPILREVSSRGGGRTLDQR